MGCVDNSGSVCSAGMEPRGRSTDFGWATALVGAGGPSLGDLAVASWLLSTGSNFAVCSAPTERSEPAPPLSRSTPTHPAHLHQEGEESLGAWSSVCTRC